MKHKHLLRSTAVCAAAACALTCAPLTVCAQEETKLIALTFDDGPNTTTTAAVLDVLEKYNVTASFFLIGDNINEESAAMVRRAHDMGCEINSHSRTHSYMSGMTAEAIRAEIEYTDNAVYEITGTCPQFFRPPYIDVSQTMYDAIDKPFICGVGCGDASADVTAQERAGKLLDAACDGQIVLLHDFPGNTATVEALETAIPALQADGYVFVTLTELFARQGETPETGKMYSTVSKYPCAGYTVYKNIFSGEVTGTAKEEAWRKAALFDSTELAGLDYAIEVTYSGEHQPVLALQRWTGAALYCAVQPRYYNGKKACFLAADVQAALTENGVGYADLDRISVIPYTGSITMTNADLLIKDTAPETVPGDVDADGTLGVTDAVMMQKYLLGVGTLTDPDAGDVCEDGCIDVFDLGIMKRMLTETEGT